VSEFQIAEFEGAWEHAKHLEQERTRHLSLYFTVLGLLAAAIGFLLRDALVSAARESILVAASVLALILQLFTLFIFVAIRRIGTARGRHERAMAHLRATLESDAVIRGMGGRFSGKRHRWLSVQGHRRDNVALVCHCFRNWECPRNLRLYREAKLVRDNVVCGHSVVGADISMRCCGNAWMLGSRTIGGR
jgi:hypothetical protein